MTSRILAGAGAVAAFLLATTLASAQTTQQPSTTTTPNTAAHPCLPSDNNHMPAGTNAGATTNGSTSSTSGTVEGAIPSTNVTRTTNTTQNGSPVEHNVANPNNVNTQPCAEGEATGATTTPSTETTTPTTTTPATEQHVPYRPGMMQQQSARNQPARDMLNDNPNGSNWLDKFNRSPNKPPR